MITGHDIVYVSTIEWTFNWQQNQEIAIRLARAGNRVLYIENTGARSPGLGDARRVASRLKRWTASLTSHGVREVASNLYVCSPLVLPPFGSGIQRGINRHILLPLIRRAARRLNMRDVLVWTYLPTDTALGLIRLFRSPKSAIVYYCLTDFPQLSSQPKQMAQSEKALLQLSDVVLTSCKELSDRLAQWTDNVHIFPMGVDLAAFPNTESREEDCSADMDQQGLGSLPRPIIGYIGGLHRHVDLDLLVEMATKRPNWSWVFVGPFQTTIEKLRGRPNIHLLGPKPHQELIRYLQCFDVCIVPYVKSRYTETVTPVKINEYLAVGKPVVATDLPTIREFNRRHNVLIVTENRAEPFLKSIDEALRLPNDVAVIARRRQVAALCDWNIQLETMSELISGRLEEKQS